MTVPKDAACPLFFSTSARDFPLMDAAFPCAGVALLLVVHFRIYALSHA